MIRARIQKWLSEGGSFREGVNCLEMTGSRSSRKFAQQLNSPFVTPQQKANLRRELTRIVGQMPIEEVSSYELEPTRVEVKDTPRISALRNKGVELLKVRSDLKGRLLQAALDEPSKYTDKERYELARQIMADNVPALDDVYGTIRRFEQEGIEPADDREMVEAEAKRKFKRLASIRPQISRLRKSEDPEDQKRLAALQKEREELETWLNN